LNVDEERVTSQSIGISNIDDGTIAIYLNAKVVSDGVKNALREVIKQKREIQEVAQQRALLQQKISVIDQEQARIRQNMQQLDRNTDLYKRYVTKFAQQEDEVESLRGQISEKQGQEDSLRKKLDTYLLSLDIS
jgi:predicted RNase H-like nuclease (RuvC/YqgF family)